MLGNPLLTNPLLGRADLARLQGLALARALEEAQKARQRAASNPQGNPPNSATPRSTASDSGKDLVDIRIRNLENRVDRLDQRMSKMFNALERHCQTLDSMHQKTAPRPKPIPQVNDDIHNIEAPTLDLQR